MTVGQKVALYRELEADLKGRGLLNNGSVIGGLAEECVATALGAMRMPNGAHPGYDLITDTGVRIQVKGRTAGVTLYIKPEYFERFDQLAVVTYSKDGGAPIAAILVPSAEALAASLANSATGLPFPNGRRVPYDRAMMPGAVDILADVRAAHEVLMAT